MVEALERLAEAAGTNELLYFEPVANVVADRSLQLTVGIVIPIVVHIHECQAFHLPFARHHLAMIAGFRHELDRMTFYFLVAFLAHVVHKIVREDLLLLVVVEDLRVLLCAELEGILRRHRPRVLEPRSRTRSLVQLIL